MEKAKKPAAKAGETITISREEYERLLEENNALNRQLDWLMEQLRLMRIMSSTTVTFPISPA